MHKLEDDVKKKIWIAALIVALILIVIGVNEWWSRGTTTAAEPCARNVESLFLSGVSASTSPTAIARTLLDQYLKANEAITDCPSVAIKDYSIVSVSNIKFVQGDFTADAVFDVLPATKDGTVWATASSTWDGTWIRGIHSTLGIQNFSTATTTQYRLVL